MRRLLKRSAVGLRFGRRTQALVARRMIGMRELDPLGRLVELIALLDVLARSRDATEISTAGFVPSLRVEDRQRIDRVYRFVNENFTGQLGLDAAARLVHMSASTFSRFFHRTSGKHFTAYVNELRIGSACRLLIETDRGISQIALEVGFGNLSNFNRRFLELKKMRPRDYRQHFRRGWPRGRRNPIFVSRKSSHSSAGSPRRASPPSSLKGELERPRFFSCFSSESAASPPRWLRSSPTGARREAEPCPLSTP